MIIQPRNAIFLIFLFLFMSLVGRAAPAASFSAKAVVESTDLFVGEAFILQIQVSGSENPEEPDLSSLADFSVKFRGGQQNSSRSVTIVNGKVTQNVREGYVFSYQLIPERSGKLVIPSITVHADGLTTRTNPIPINARKPEETDDFKLRLNLSKTRCYVGEPITLTVTWYIGKDVRDFAFSLPLLKDDEIFHFADPDTDTQSGKKLYRIPLRDQEVIGEKGRGRIEGKDFATITFRKILIPKQSGHISIEPATVTCNALVGYERRRSRFQNDFFSDFFSDGFFGNSQRGVYRNMVVPSNPLSLQILPLPDEGRPAGFSGLVGEFTIKASATPTDLSVGDPITLTLLLSGPDYLEHVNLPPLSGQPDIIRDFKIPKERATGEISGRSKIFTQTIRALRSDVTEIPAIELAYFDTRSQTYRVAKTEPIPITVKETKIVTAMDAEGIREQISSGTEIETWSKGIAFNYEDMSVIENQRFGPSAWLMTPMWMGILLVPPIMFMLLLATTGLIRRRNADPMKAVAKRAYRTLIKGLRDTHGSTSAEATCERVLDAFRNYLGDKMGIPGGSLTFKDVKDRLAAQDVDQTTLDELNTLFHTCEAGHYAGTADLSDTISIAEKAVEIAKKLEKLLK